MAAYRYDKVLDRELATLAKEEEFYWSIEEALIKQWEKSREKEALVKQKQAIAYVPIFNPKSVASASLPSIIKLTPPLTVTTTSPAFLLIEEINDNNNDSMDMKDPQKQKKRALNFEVYIMVEHAGPPTI